MEIIMLNPTYELFQVGKQLTLSLRRLPKHFKNVRNVKRVEMLLGVTQSA